VFQVGSQTVSVSADGALVPVGPEGKVAMIQFGAATIVSKAKPVHSSEYHLKGRARTPKTSWALERLLVRDAAGDGFVISDASIAALKKDFEKYGITFALSQERLKYEGDHSARILKIYEGEQCIEELWIDPARGFICPKEKQFHPTDGSVMYDTAAENFILDEHSQKWFPQKVIYSAWMGTKENMITVYSEVYVTPGTLILNKPIPDSIFSLDVPKGMRIADVRREDNSTTAFVAKQPGKLDLSAAENKDFLDDAEWLRTRPVRQYEPPLEIEKAPQWTWTRIFFVSLGVVMIVLGIIIQILRFFKKSV
jgi:hypothetical protein